MLNRQVIRRWRVRGRESGRGEDRERGGRARLGYLSRGPRVPSYATGHAVTVVNAARTRPATAAETRPYR